jgi:pimeloyl-ACP methyl ester carboxylesterase
VQNGVTTVRFDQTNHVGVSDGDIYFFTLSSAVDDIKTVLSNVRTCYPDRPIALIGASLSGRTAIRTLVECAIEVESLILLLPVVDVEKTVIAAAKADVFALYEQGHTLEYLVSENVVHRNFIEDVCENEFRGITGTSKELNSFVARVTTIGASKDD